MVCNTFGAVVGKAAAAFFLLRFYSVSTAFATAIAINTLVGLVSIALEKHVAASLKMIDIDSSNGGQPLESEKSQFGGFRTDSGGLGFSDRQSPDLPNVGCLAGA